MNDPLFRQWLTDHHGFTAEESAYAPTGFIRSDEYFDCTAWELQVEAWYREYQSERDSGD